ncbi:TIGR02680 family protein [Streptomyces sp. NPDC018000]|uniref:TIGR02680 family protein n=1 Tax=Streptomyces sp. NPDC018000 TaxID=3365028 RepID=UPI0037958EB3
MTRFQPTRAGIVNLWDYRDEEFCFADGWLVLRGANGSGKTKALEVLFPYVLDGRIDPKRLNPFAAEDRTMKSNLLYRGQESALGYVWLELRHQDTGEAVTVGIGLHAHRHRDTPQRWHFVTSGRVGRDFSLLTADDRPLTRKQLAAELGEEVLVGSAADYRAAIDRRLFGLGRERYEQFLTLVLTLRRPQLAKNLDPAKLSDTLSDGLRPLDDDLIAEAARSFDDMESVARTLEGLAAADEATRAFLATYSTYLRVHARWAADALSRRRAATGEQRQAVADAARACQEAEGRRSEAEAAVESCQAAQSALRARLDQLKSSAAYQAVEQLADLERLVRTCEEALSAAVHTAERRAAQTARAEARAASARGLLQELVAAASRTAAELADRALAAGIGWGEADADEAGLAERAAARAAERQDAVRAVRGALAAGREADQAHTLAQRAADDAGQAAGEAEEEVRRHELAVDEARQTAEVRLSAWESAHPELLDDAGLAAVREALAAVGEAGASALPSAFDEAARERLAALHERRHTLRGERETLLREREHTAGERAEVAAERDDAPPRHPGRTADRAGRDGAPLWRLVRFADGLGEARAAAVEAALDASGMLDAWLAPAPAARHEGEDAWLEPSAPVTGPSLADALVPEEFPEEDAPVPAPRIAALLASIALGHGEGTGEGTGARVGEGTGARVGQDGGWAHGVTVGRATKAHPEYIGATARARRRAARLDGLDARLAELERQLLVHEQDLDRVAARVEAYAAARTALPATAPIAAALREAHTAAGALRSARQASEAARARLDEASAHRAAAERRLRRTAAEHALDPERTDAVADAVHRFESAARDLMQCRREHARQQETVDESAARLAEAAEEEQAARDAERAARLNHTEEKAKLDALHEAVGAEAEQVLAEVERARVELAGAEGGYERAVASERAAFAEATGAAERATAARVALATAAREELQTARALGPYATRELLDLLGCPPEANWPAQEADWSGDELPAAAVAVHEAILYATRDLTPTDNSLKQSTTRLTKALEDLQTQLTAAGQDYHPSWDSADGVITVRVTDETGPLPAAVFAGRIAAARHDQQMLLSEAEQRILQDALLTRLAQQIHERTLDARDLIRGMDREMRARRMSSGTTVGVAWQLADHLDDTQRAVCKLLDTDATRLTPDQLASMRAHFADRIKAERAGHREQPYRELLARVLDYRTWRTFAFHLARPGGEEERLTRARHSRLSGGEQSVSLHLPLFAAAHAMLNSAASHAPRLLALDEAFAGVDDTGRSELMSLAAQFDLDLFMTGYDLWAAHTDVPACAHYDLAHSAVDHTVSALLLLWDGKALIADDADDLARALGSPGTRVRPARPARPEEDAG